MPFLTSEDNLKVGKTPIHLPKPTLRGYGSMPLPQVHLTPLEKSRHHQYLRKTFLQRGYPESIYRTELGLFGSLRLTEPTTATAPKEFKPWLWKWTNATFVSIPMKGPRQNAPSKRTSTGPYPPP